MLKPAFDLLLDLAPSLFEGGAYTSGNTQSLQLLGQSAVTMIRLGPIKLSRQSRRACFRKPRASCSFRISGFRWLHQLAVLSNGVNKDAALSWQTSS